MAALSGYDAPQARRSVRCMGSNAAPQICSGQRIGHRGCVLSRSHTGLVCQQAHQAKAHCLNCGACMGTRRHNPGHCVNGWVLPCFVCGHQRCVVIEQVLSKQGCQFITHTEVDGAAPPAAFGSILYELEVGAGWVHSVSWSPSGRSPSEQNTNLHMRSRCTITTHRGCACGGAARQPHRDAVWHAARSNPRTNTV